MAQSALASVKTKWSIEQFRIALGILVCLYADKFRGTNYGRANLRLEEVALYCYAEANLQLPRSCGCYMVGLNGALIEMETEFFSQHCRFALWVQSYLGVRTKQWQYW